MTEPNTNPFFFFFIFFILVLILHFLFKTRPKSNPNLPPGPPSLPILGHLHLLKPPHSQTLLHLSQKYGPVMSIRFGSRPAVIVTSPTAVEQCFTKSNDVSLANRPLLPSTKNYNYDYTTMGAAPYGHLWRSLRRLAATDLLSTTRLDATAGLREHQLKLICKQILNTCNSWDAVDRNNRTVNLKFRFRDLLNNLTTMAIIGKRFYGDEIDEADVKQAAVFREMMEEFFRLLHTPNIGDFVPVVGWLGLGGVEKKMIGLMERVDRFLDEVVEERRRVGWSESGLMVDRLIGLQSQEPEVYTDQIIKGFIMIMLIAGTETPYLTLEWAMSAFLNNPNAIQTIKTEIDNHIGSDRLLQETDLDKLPYLQNAINESLRLYPTLPLLLPRETSEDISIDGYHVPRGTMLMVNAWAIHRDPTLWEEPEKFMPERFNNRGDQDKYKMLGFSAGRRGCPGTNLGYRILGLTLGTLIQVFDWERVGNEEVDMSAFYGMSMAKLKPLEAVCKPRANMIAHVV